MSLIVVFLVLINCVVVGSDFVAIASLRLRYLGITFPRTFEYTPLIAAALGLVVWLTFKNRFPKSVLVAAFLICWLPIAGATKWAESKTEEVRITKWIEGRDLSTMEAHLGFKICETGDARGTRLLVEKGDERLSHLIDETKRLGIFRP